MGLAQVAVLGFLLKFSDLVRSCFNKKPKIKKCIQDDATGMS